MNVNITVPSEVRQTAHYATLLAQVPRKAEATRGKKSAQRCQLRNKLQEITRQTTQDSGWDKQRAGGGKSRFLEKARAPPLRARPGAL